MEKFNYWIAFITVDDELKHFHHFVGVNEYPSENDISEFYKELTTDEEFKLPIEILKELKYEVYTSEEFEEYCRPMLQ